MIKQVVLQQQIAKNVLQENFKISFPQPVVNLVLLERTQMQHVKRHALPVVLENTKQNYNRTIAKNVHAELIM